MSWTHASKRIDVVGECWLWRGQINWGGYGVHTWKENGRAKGQGAHRFVYEFLVGKVPNGLTLDHQCENKHCVNPMHLIPETLAYNVLRGNSPPAQNSRKTHCPQGHLYEPRKRHHRQRYCRPCNTEAQRRYVARRRIALFLG